MIRECLHLPAFAAFLVVSFLAGSAAADNTPVPDSNGGRYTFSRQGEGFIRLDSQTGQVALCSRKAVGLACEMAPEDRTLLENEIARLRGENAELKKALLSRGLPLPSGSLPLPDNGSQGNTSNLRLPSDADIDRAFDFASRVWQRFLEAVDRAQKQILNKS